MYLVCIEGKLSGQSGFELGLWQVEKAVSVSRQ
jgi:hypothetical protein